MVLRITGGIHRGRRLRSSGGAGLRPTSDRVRSAIFSILGQDAAEGARVLDLYAGTGALGLEALSRGAAQADFVEASARRCQQIREHLRELSLAEKGKVYAGRVERVLASLSGGYDLVLADPPYEMDSWDSLMALLNEGGLLNEDCFVVVEHRHDTELAGEYGKLFLVTRRRYGDTAVSIYRSGAGDG
jgi:16S rRNA (guanine966-N2)-methyltransferase